MVTLAARIARIERLAPQPVAEPTPMSPLPAIMAAVCAQGGRLANETWVEATARLAGTSARELMTDLRRRADAR